MSVSKRVRNNKPSSRTLPPVKTTQTWEEVLGAIRRSGAEEHARVFLRGLVFKPDREWNNIDCRKAVCDALKYAEDRLEGKSKSIKLKECRRALEFELCQ